MSSGNYRQKCFDAHGAECARCEGAKSSAGVVAHHIDGDRENNSVENLAPLCRACHETWHKQDLSIRFEEFVGNFPDQKIDTDYQKHRALLTDREREILLNDGEDVTDKYYGVVVSRVRKKIELVGDDLEALAQHETLADELRDAVCHDEQ